MSIREDRMKKAISDSGLTYAELEEKTGISKSALQRYVTGVTKKIPIDCVEAIAEATGVSSAYLLGWAQEEVLPLTAEPEPSNLSAVYTDHIRMIPVYETVSAGFGTHAEDAIIDYIPIRIVSDYEAAESIGIRVSGSSMYPKIEDGDIVLVHRQTSVDSGDIAVLLIDGEEGVVKKVIYGTDWVDLISINPEYMPRRFEGADLERLSVVGKVKGSYKPF